MKPLFKFFLIFMLTTLMAAGCSDYLDINEDPNNPLTAPLNGLLYQTTFETVRNTQRAGSTTSFFVQHLASPVQGAASDIHQSASYGTIWSELYFNLSNLTILIEQAEEVGSVHYSGIAKIMKAYNLSLLVNIFGDVPYSEAFNDDNLQPAYDSSESIYEVIYDLITEGLANLHETESAESPAEDDMIFEGDLGSWILTAYALRARYLNHLSKSAAYNPQAVLEAVDNAFASSDDDFELHFFSGEDTAAENQWYRTALNNSNLLLGGWLSTQIVDQLNGTTYGVVDPRIDFITEPAVHPDFEGQYIGTDNGAGRGSAPEQGVRAVLTVGSYYASGPTAPLEMITYAELKFIEAEASLAANNPARAYQAYEEGVRAHMEKLGVDPADIDTYWNEPSVSVGAGSLTINEIMKEKYVATFLNPETWNDARRYDYGYEGFQLPQNHSSDAEGDFLRTARPPDSEVQRNQANIPTMSLQQRVFWDNP